MQTIESQVLSPLLNPRTDPPPISPFFFFFFCFLKNLLRLKINILSSIYPEINFPAEPVMIINNLSRPKVPATPPPQDQMVVPLLQGEWIKFMFVIIASPLSLAIALAIMGIIYKKIKYVPFWFHGFYG